MSILDKVLDYFRKQSEKSSGKMSFDSKLFFFSFIALIFLLNTTIFSTPGQMVVFVCVLFVVLLFVSIAHKIKHKWHWPGISVRNIISALANLTLGFLFLALVSYILFPRDIPPWEAGDLKDIIKATWNLILQAGSNPDFTPWLLCGAFIIMGNTLQSLKLTTTNQKEFLKHCKTDQPVSKTYDD